MAEAAEIELRSHMDRLDDLASTPPKASLLGLAREVRLKIFGHLFQEQVIVIGGYYDGQDGSGPYPTLRRISRIKCPEILLTNRQLSEEAFEVLAASITLRVQDLCPSYATSMAPTAALTPYIRIVELGQSIYTSLLRSCQTLDLASFKQLRVLHIDFDGCGSSGFRDHIHLPPTQDLSEFCDQMDGTMDRFMMEKAKKELQRYACIKDLLDQPGRSFNILHTVRAYVGLNGRPAYSYWPYLVVRVIICQVFERLPDQCYRR